jgi:hypothetical protein
MSVCPSIFIDTLVLDLDMLDMNIQSSDFLAKL